MSESWIDPGSLEGDALAQWYLRSPADIERGRQQASARRHQDFFCGNASADPGPDFGRAVPAGSQDVNPGFSLPALASSEDIDLGLSWVPAGPNRFRSVRVATDSPSTAVSFDGGAPPAGGVVRSHVSYRAPEGIPPVRSRSRQFSGSPNASPLPADARKIAAPHQVMGGQTYWTPATPPLPTFFSSLFGGPVPLTSPEGQVVGYYDHQAAKAGLGIMAHYAQIASWLQPAGWMDGLIAGGGSRIALSGAAPAVRVVESGMKAPLNFLEREAWQGGPAVEQAARSLSDAAKAALRRQARDRFAQASGISASEIGAKVHHSKPLEYAHLEPAADPNRLANLWGLADEAHQIASNQWTAFRAALKGRIPSQAEIMAAKLRIDRMVEPYLLRAGLSRPGPTPK